MKDDKNKYRQTDGGNRRMSQRDTQRAGEGHARQTDR
jgi:hypothetical protein